MSMLKAVMTISKLSWQCPCCSYSFPDSLGVFWIGWRLFGYSNKCCNYFKSVGTIWKVFGQLKGCWKRGRRCLYCLKSVRVLKFMAKWVSATHEMHSPKKLELSLQFEIYPYRFHVIRALCQNMLCYRDKLRDNFVAQRRSEKIDKQTNMVVWNLSVQFEICLYVQLRLVHTVWNLSRPYQIVLIFLKLSIYFESCPHILKALWTVWKYSEQFYRLFHEQKLSGHNTCLSSAVCRCNTSLSTFWQFVYILQRHVWLKVEGTLLGILCALSALNPAMW